MKEKFEIRTPQQTLHCCQWTPICEPVGVIQIIHGIKEYAERYDDFANFFSAQGFIVVAADHPGHGMASLKDGSLGYLTGGWRGAIRGVHDLHQHMRSIYPGLPYIIFGHSMGSFMLTTYLAVTSQKPDAAILSGTGWLSNLLLDAGLAACKIEESRIGEGSASPLLEKLMFGTYNARIKSPVTAHDWICSAKPVVQAYAENPLCTWTPSVHICTEMLRAIKRNQDRSNLKKIPKDLPLFFIAGQDDPVGNYGNGVLKAVSKFKEAGMRNIAVELYPNMRHECHNEPEKDRVYADLFRWIREQTAVENTKGCNL